MHQSAVTTGTAGFYSGLRSGLSLYDSQESFFRYRRIRDLTPIMGVYIEESKIDKETSTLVKHHANQRSNRRSHRTPWYAVLFLSSAGTVYHAYCFEPGPNVVRAFLEPSVHPSQVNRVVVFTRTATSAAAQGLKDLGAEVIEGAPTVEGFKGIDVFVSVLNDRVPTDARDAYTQAAIEAGVKVYFPNDFVAYVFSMF